MLLLADWVVPISSAPLAEAGVRVVGGTIAEVAPAAELRARWGDDEIRSFLGCALLPGFVNAHTHLELSAFRGFARPSGFGSWMLHLLLARRKLDPADYQAAALWGAYECLRCGITSLADTAYDGATVARAVGVAGLRARVYQEVFGLDDAVLPATMERLESAVGWLQAEAAGAAPLVEAGVSPHAPYTVSARLYREAARFARRAGLRLATHVAESPAEVELLARGTGAIARAYRTAQMWTDGDWRPSGLRPVAYVGAAGALGTETLAIHAVQVNAEEVGAIASRGTAVAHCPRSNARLRCGTAPVADLLGAGVLVGLGTDSLASNDSFDMFAEMRAALEAGQRRAATVGSLPVTAAQVLGMATLEGARALGWAAQTGSLEPGKSADVIAVHVPGTDGPPATTGLPASLVQSACAADVRMTMVAGTVLYEGGTTAPAVASGIRTARGKLGLTG